MALISPSLYQSVNDLESQESPQHSIALQTTNLQPRVPAQPAQIYRVFGVPVIDREHQIFAYAGLVFAIAVMTGVICFTVWAEANAPDKLISPDMSSSSLPAPFPYGFWRF